MEMLNEGWFYTYNCVLLYLQLVTDNTKSILSVPNKEEQGPGI